MPSTTTRLLALTELRERRGHTREWLCDQLRAHASSRVPRLTLERLEAIEAGGPVSLELAEQIGAALGYTVGRLEGSLALPSLARMRGEVTQAALARAAGCTRRTITSAEGGGPVSLETARMLAEALGCTVEDLETPSGDSPERGRPSETGPRRGLQRLVERFGVEAVDAEWERLKSEHQK